MSKKDTFYFSHDSNAFHDPKIIKLRAKHGLEGYGFYWALIEFLRNQPEYFIKVDDLELLSFHMNFDESKINQMVSTCLANGLLENKNDKIFSTSLLRRMEIADDIRKKRVLAGKKGGRPKANGKQNESKTKALKESKGKENKVNEIKTKEKKYQKEFLIFDVFRNLYPGNKRGLETEFNNFQKKHKDWKEVLPELSDLLKCQINQRNLLVSQGQFVPQWKHLQTWINQRCWEENYPTQDKPIDTTGGW